MRSVKKVIAVLLAGLLPAIALGAEFPQNYQLTPIDILVSAPNGGVPAYPLLSPNGSASAPSHSFTLSPSTGMFSPNPNQLAFSTNGIQALLFASNQAATFATNVTINGVVLCNSGIFTNPTNNRPQGLVVGGNGAPILQQAQDANSSAYSTLTAVTVRQYSGAGLGFINAGNFTAALTANKTIVSDDVGTTFTNTGAAGTVALTLPTITAGLVGYKVRLSVVAAQTMTLAPAGSDLIYAPALAQTTKTLITSPVVTGATVEVVATALATWSLQVISGTWTSN